MSVPVERLVGNRNIPSEANFTSVLVVCRVTTVCDHVEAKALPHDSIVVKRTFEISKGVHKSTSRYLVFGWDPVKCGTKLIT